MVCGIAGFITYGITGVVAIFLAVNAKKQILQGMDGEGMRKAGLVCGIVSASFIPLFVGCAILSVAVTGVQ